MTFTEYERKFNELSKFGPGLIDTPLLKNEKFIHGARPEYYKLLTAHVHGTFTELMDFALRYEGKPKGTSVPKAPVTQTLANQSGKRKQNFEQQKKNWQQKSGIGYS